MNYEQALSIIRNKSFIDSSTSFAIARLCTSLLRNKESESNGRDLVIRIQDIWELVAPQTHEMWNDITEAAGLYPYVKPERLSSSSLLRYEYHKSPHLNIVYLHEEQQKISINL